ncbi:hypothetical protein [Rubrivirga sp. IMCC45206]|uniref:hypothetical protein n=1 Tax=Rubrivirga sp. IMCC45206 TaxID=3391614 RepID=UPI00398FA114
MRGLAFVVVLAWTASASAQDAWVPTIGLDGIPIAGDSLAASVPPPVDSLAFAPDGPAGGTTGVALLIRDAPTAVADTTEDVRKAPLPLTVFGYYRLFLYGRNITEPYPNLAPFERAYGVGDGYREPMLSLTVLGRPNGRSSFGSELFVYTPYEGTEDENNTINLNLGVNFYGTFRTDAGTYGVRTGGIHWYNLSPFTIGVYQVLDRFSIFDRTPWEGVTGATKYDSYFETGQANPGDARWNYQAFQGLILDGRELPGGIGFDAFVGKTQPNGGLPNALTDPAETVALDGQAGDVPTYDGFAGDSRALPSYITGGRLQRAFGDDLLAVNSIYSFRTLDSLTSARREYQVHTASFDVTHFGVNLSGELGASKFESPTYDSKWGEALMVRAKTTASTTRLPLDVQVYQVGRHFFNENGEIATSNHPQIQADPRCEVVAGQGSSGGHLTQVNQLAHNRRGVNLNTAWERGPARLAVGWGVSHELAPTTSTLSYIHRVNGLAVSRIYNPFPAEATCATQFGPLDRQYSFFRGVFERVPTTDVDPVTGLATTRKYFHAVDLQGKLRARVLDRPAYLFYLASFGSANRSLQAVPRDDDTYLFVQYHELDAYVELFEGFLLTGYLGLENARGGRFTEVDATSGLPRDQIGTGVGIGFDWTLARNTGLFVRHRWMDFEDRSFAVDTYSGQETTVELKIFL